MVILRFGIIYLIGQRSDFGKVFANYINFVRLLSLWIISIILTIL